jgi:outer membrane protein TolC
VPAQGPCKIIRLILAFVIFAAASPGLAEPVPAAEPLTLEMALKRAIDRNLDLKLLRLQLKASEITYDTAWATMFMPTVTLSASSTTDYTLGDIPGRTPQPPELRNHGYPVSSVTLGLGRYTLYNFNRDWYVYERAKLDWQRAQEAYQETVRTTRFNVITGFFTLKAEQDKLDAANRSVLIADAIVKLIKSRVRRRKATDNDVSSSIVDLLSAKNDQNQRASDAKQALWALNLLLGDAIDTPYRIDESIRYVPLKITSDQATKAYLESSPAARDFLRDLRKAELSLTLEERNRLPLPKVSFSGVEITAQSGYYGGFSDYHATTGAATVPTGNTNFDIRGEVTFTVPIYGPGGLLNARVVETASLAVDQVQLKGQQKRSQDEINILLTIQTIRRTEQSIENNRQSLQRSAQLLESQFAKLSGTEVSSRLELRDALRQARESEFALVESTLSHLSNKLNLAALIGVDSLPGDTYR